MRVFKILFGLFFSLYLIIGFVLYANQEKLLFRPDKLSEEYIFKAGEEVEVLVSDDISLNCLWLKTADSRGVILYLHGNRGNNRRCLYQAEAALSGNNYDIFMPDYRGFGKTEGTMSSEDQMYEDVQAVYDFLKKHYDEKNIAIAGYSIGTGPSAYLAANNNPEFLFLIAPYYSIVDMKNRYFPFFPDFVLKYKFRNDENIKNVNCPVTIFHGTSDEVLPYDSSVKLKALRPNEVDFFTLKGVNHRQTIFQSKVRTTISKALR